MSHLVIPLYQLGAPRTWSERWLMGIGHEGDGGIWVCESPTALH